MKSKSLLLVIVTLICTNNLFAQEFAVDKGAAFISGQVAFASQGGELFEDANGNKLSSFSLLPNVNYFIFKSLFLGVGLEFASEIQGNYTSRGIGVGPQIGYAFGNENSTIFPYIGIGMKYYDLLVSYGSRDTEAKTTDLFLGAGLIIPVKSHLGLTLDIGYHVSGIDSGSGIHLGNTLGVSLGIVGLLYR
jgi:hypothetical protein